MPDQYGTTTEQEWKPMLSEVYELLGSLRVNATVDTDAGRLRREDFDVGRPDLGANNNGDVYLHASDYDDDGGAGVGMYLTPEQARGMAQALELAADYAEKGEYADVI